MGFNFGAFLGGAATQITKDIDEEEKRVKLRMDKILDRQQELTIQNQKEYKAKKEKVQNQMNALVPLFGGGPDAIAKARSFEAGGDNHFNFMFKTLSEASKDKRNDVNELYTLLPDSGDVGFESVEDATNSLVKMAKLPEIKLGESTQFAKMLGIDAKTIYDKSRVKLEEEGLLPNTKEAFDETVKKYRTGSMNFQKLQKEVKDVQTMYAENTQAILDLNKDDPKYKEKRAKLEADNKIITEQVSNMNNVSASVKTEKLRQQGKEATGQTLTEMKNLYKDSRNKFEKSLGLKNGAVVNDDGKTLFEEEATAYVNKKLKEWDKDYVKGLVDGNGNLIDDSADSQAFIKAFGLDIYLGKPDEEETQVTPKKETKKEKVQKIIKDNPELTESVARNLLDLNQGTKTTITNPMQLSDMLMQSYPKKANETQQAYEERMDNLAQVVWSKYSEEKKIEQEEKKRLAELRKKRFGDAVPEDKKSQAQIRAEARKGKR